MSGEVLRSARWGGGGGGGERFISPAVGLPWGGGGGGG